MNKEFFGISGRVILVTGASKGLGKAVAAALASAGADIALYGGDKQDLENVKLSVQALGRKAEVFLRRCFG